MAAEKVYHLEVNRWPNHAREWAARIAGPDKKYGFAREFCRVVKRDWSRSGKHGTTTIELPCPGFYEISNPRTGLYGWQARYYARLTEDWSLVEVEKREVEEYFGIAKDVVNQQNKTDGHG